MLSAYQLAQPQPDILIQKTFLVPEESNFANFYIFLHRQYALATATTVLKALIALQTFPNAVSVLPLPVHRQIEIRLGRQEPSSAGFGFFSFFALLIWGPSTLQKTPTPLSLASSKTQPANLFWSSVLQPIPPSRKFTAHLS